MLVQTEFTLSTLAIIFIIIIFLMTLEFTQITQVWVRYFKTVYRAKSTQDGKVRFIKGNEKLIQDEVFFFSFLKRVSFLEKFSFISPTNCISMQVHNIGYVSNTLT